MSQTIDGLRGVVEYGLREGKTSVIADLAVLRELFALADAGVSVPPATKPIDPHKPLMRVLTEARARHPIVRAVFSLWESGTLKTFEECLITLAVNLIDANDNVQKSYYHLLKHSPPTYQPPTDPPARKSGGGEYPVPGIPGRTYTDGPTGRVYYTNGVPDNVDGD